MNIELSPAKHTKHANAETQGTRHRRRADSSAHSEGGHSCPPEPGWSGKRTWTSALHSRRRRSADILVRMDSLGLQERTGRSVLLASRFRPLSRLLACLAGPLLFTSPFCLLPSAFAQGTLFTYQGKLTESGAPAQGIFDLRSSMPPAAATSKARRTRSTPCP